MYQQTTYQQTTRNIQVTVQPIFLEEQSSPDESYFVWAYNVKIENGGTETVQLRSRYWRITDARGRIDEVRGPGVVGEQPVLGPGESFEYTSGTPLPARIAKVRAKRPALMPRLSLPTRGMRRMKACTRRRNASARMA